MVFVVSIECINPNKSTTELELFELSTSIVYSIGEVNGLE